MEIKRVRGVKDILPQEVEKIKLIVSVCNNIMEKFGFREVILPVIENIDLYKHSIGETSDIVEKQMFQILDRGQQEQQTESLMVLRPEGTAGMLRMYVENRLREKFHLRRFFYFGPMFRYERPQKGRYREFYQFGMEVLGEPPPLSDLLLIKIINMILENLSIKYELEVNSIGCKICRKNFITFVQNKFEKIKNFLCDVCQNRINKNPLRILDCKTDKKQLEEKFNILEELMEQKFLCNNCKTDFDKILHLMQENKIKYKILPTLVRGLDYYNGFVFEYKTKLLEAAQDTICAGGRYDSLVEVVDKQTMYGCGAAFGIDRMAEIMTKISPEYKIDKKIKIGVAIVDDKFLFSALQVVEYLLSENNYIVIGPFSNKSLKSQLRLFNNEKCKFVIFVGEEIQQNKIVVKDFSLNMQKLVEINQLKQILTL